MKAKTQKHRIRDQCLYESPVRCESRPTLWRKTATTLLLKTDELKPSLNMHTWIVRLRRRRVVCIFNFVTLLLLSWHTIFIIRSSFEANFADFRSMKLSPAELPYPMNIISQFRKGQLTELSDRHSFQAPGYVGIRNATFRDMYPSQGLEGTGTFDGIFVISGKRCANHINQFRSLAIEAGMTATVWQQTEPRRISLDNPPFPISPAILKRLGTMTRADVTLMKRHIAYFEAHRELWQHISKTGKQRSLIIDDTLFPTERLQRSLPSVLSNIDQESVARHQPWHFVFLRRQALQYTSSSKRLKEKMWTMNEKYKHPVVIANVSLGASAYVLSRDGAKFLETHTTVFRAPLDIEIGLLQREFPTQFVALSACNNDVQTPFCPEMIRDISSSFTTVSNCVWRRLHERHSIEGTRKYFQ